MHCTDGHTGTRFIEQVSESIIIVTLNALTTGHQRGWSSLSGQGMGGVTRGHLIMNTNTGA